VSTDEQRRTPDLAAARTEALSADDRHVLVRRFRLRVEQGADAGRELVSQGERVVIGSEDGVDLHLTDGAVSRFHCEVRVEEGRARIRDLGSRNGTIVDGVTIHDAELNPRATITVGRTQVRFDLGDDHLRVPLSGAQRFGMLVGRSPAMRAVFATLEKLAASDATVLLEGETGTGKEATALSLHEAGPRRDAPFVVVDCGAVPPGLLESELFGHERGAFTGAIAAREGAFEAAHGGTVFLDEIGELAPELQPKLLRVLESRQVKRVGAAHHAAVDVRIVAATNRDLRAEVNARRFRADLYYRLAVVTVRLPSLRERADDLPLLVEHLAAPLGAAGAPLREPGFVGELARHPWPGNVRELRNYLERCAALGIDGPAAPSPDPGGGPGGAAGDLAVDATRSLREQREAFTARFERAYLQDLLRLHPDNRAAAARAAGIDRAHLYRLLWRHGLA